MMSKFEHGEGLFMFDGDWESGNLDKLMPGKVGFFLMPTLEGRRQAHRDVGAAHLRDRGKGEARRLRRVLLQLDRDQRRRRARSTSRSAGRTPAARRTCRSRCRRRARDRADARGGQGRRQGERCDGLHRERDRGDLRAVVDA